MPKLEPTRPREPWVPSWVEAILAARERFAATLQRSRRGNLWRTMPSGARVSVFARGARWSYSIATARGVRFSKCDFFSELEAIGGLACALGVE
jgi:hypothetical protein